MSMKTAFLSPYPKEIKSLLQPAILRRLQKEKRGQGYGKDYQPFLTVRDVPSKGRVHRRPALTNNRIVHLLSDLELAAFLLFDWNLLRLHLITLQLYQNYLHLKLNFF